MVDSPPDVYDRTILHGPTNIAPDGPVGRTKSLLSRKFRLTLQDERVLLGTFSAFDKFGNIVLTEVVEGFGELKRTMPMVIVPLSYCTAGEIKVSQPDQS
jgi:small nuclear ribonucleoprotein (snRNP)-like protein